MKTAHFETVKTDSFAHIFQSAPYWHGVGYGFIPRIVRELRSTQHKKSYLIRFGERLLVLSVAVGSESFIDAHGQKVNPIIDQVFKAGIGPRLVYSSPEKGFVVSEYLEGRCWEQDDYQGIGNIERIAQVLKQLHALPVEGPVFSSEKLEQRYWSEISHEQLAVPDGFHALQQRMQHVISYVQENYQEQAVCHNNLHVSNVLEVEQKLRFVGWENASINDPYYDLAVIAYQHGFDDVQVDQLLFHYAGKVGDEQREHFYYSYAIYVYLETLRCRAEGGSRLDASDEQRIDSLFSVLHRLDM